MRNIFLKLALTLFFFVLAYNLPIYPYLSEVREYTQEQESLLQKWELTSLSDYYHNWIFARSAWVESTTAIYTALAIAYPACVVVLGWKISGWVVKTKT